MKYVYGIDPGLNNIGVVFLPYEHVKSGLNFSKLNGLLDGGELVFKYFGTQTKKDLGTRVREIREFFDNLFREYPPVFIFLEDVDFRPFISRKSQAYLFGGLVTVLGSLTPDAGYYLINKVLIKESLHLMDKGKAFSKQKTHEMLLKEVPLLQKVKEEYRVGKRYEHLFDALIILLAGVSLIRFKN